MTQLKQIIDKHLEQCYKLHNIKIPDKCLPYLVEIAKEIHNNAIKLAVQPPFCKTDVSGSAWSLRTPKNYSEGSGCWEVVWKGIFMPFDVICGLDGCPPDNEDYTKYKKTHWWVCPKTKHDVCNVHDISMFIDLPHSKEFKKLEDAINYCLNWRKEWLNLEFSRIFNN